MREDEHGTGTGASGPPSPWRLYRHLFLAVCVFVLVAGIWGVRRYLRSPGHLVRHGTPEEQVWALTQLPAAEGEDKSDTADHGLEALESPTPLVRHAAVGTLETVRSPESHDALVERARSDPDIAVRVHALNAAVGMDPENSIQLLKEALADREDAMRAAAVRLVCRHGLRDLLGTVKKLANDSSPEVQRAVIEAFELLQPDPTDTRPAPLAGNPDRIVWEAEHGISLRDQFERAPASDELDREKDPLFRGLAGFSGDGWVRNLQGAGGNHPLFGGPTGELNIGRVSYPIHVPKAGRYRLWARMWFMDKCGDSFWYWIDHGRRYEVNQGYPDPNPRQWRNWVWFADYRRSLRLTAGTHMVHVEAREDGVRFDQFCMVREGANPPARYQGPYAANQVPARLAADGIDVSISRDGIAVGEGGLIRGSVFVVRRGNGPRVGVLEIDPADGELASPERIPVLFDGEQRLVRKDFKLTFPANSPCSERLIAARLSPKPAGESAQRQIIVTKPWPWQLAGPFSYKHRHAKPDFNVTGWKKAPLAMHDPYGLMDFQQVFGRTASGVVLLRTRIKCDQDGEYVWYLNSDDESKVWMDGELVIQNNYNLPASQLLIRRRVRVSKGVHLIEAAIWQEGFDQLPHIYTDTQNYWQFRLRVRKNPVTPAPIQGIPFE